MKQNLLLVGMQTSTVTMCGVLEMDGERLNVIMNVWYAITLEKVTGLFFFTEDIITNTSYKTCYFDMLELYAVQQVSPCVCILTRWSMAILGFNCLKISRQNLPWNMRWQSWVSMISRFNPHEHFLLRVYRGPGFST
jgi:hypothetical protein